MKKTLSILLVFTLILGTLFISACSSSDKKEKGAEVDEKNLSFSTIADLKSSGTTYEFIENNRGIEHVMIVCNIKKDASGDLTVPAEYDGKEVVALLSEDPSNASVTSITLDKGVSYIENCFSEKSDALTALTLSDAATGIYNIFNNAVALAEVTFTDSIKVIDKSFNTCAALAKIETSGYVHDILDSFKDDTALATVTIGGSIQKIEGSFDNCGVTSLDFTENIHGMSKSFNSCPALTSVTMDQITGAFFTSFNKCKALKEVTYKQGGEMINKSYNDNDVLEKVDFGSGVGNISGSFENCPKYTLPEAPAEG